MDEAMASYGSETAIVGVSEASALFRSTKALKIPRIFFECEFLVTRASQLHALFTPQLPHRSQWLPTQNASVIAEEVAER